MSLFKLGLIVNPVAGIGGKVGLKGSDGEDIRQKAFELGALAEAGARAVIALEQIKPFQHLFEIVTVAGDMGQIACDQAGLASQVISHPADEFTQPVDTENAVLTMLDKGVDLLLFAGGDGTARNVYHALAKVGAIEKLAVAGIPAGCKIHSAVYAVSPKHAGQLVVSIISGRSVSIAEADVMDIDENAFREGVVKARRYGELWVPDDNQHMQALKDGGRIQDETALQDIADFIIDEMQPDTLYFIGSGSTPAAVMQTLGLENTLLGIDLVINNKLIASDLTEQQILTFIDQAIADKQPVKIIITVIGGQGVLFGRGNQQISARVIKKTGLDNIFVLATPEKIQRLESAPFRVDTGDTELDQQLSGLIKVITGYNQHMLYRIVN